MVSTISLYRLRGASTRVLSQQIWPLLSRVTPKNCSIEAARSASSRIIAADLPPSSRVTGRSSRPHASAIQRPAALEPVNETLSTPGGSTRYAPTYRPPGTPLSTPSGRPAAAAASATRNASSTVSSAGLRTMVQPEANAGAILRNEIDCGTFQGTIAPTTPMGCFDTSDVPPNMPGRDSSSGALVIKPL